MFNFRDLKKILQLLGLKQKMVSQKPRKYQIDKDSLAVWKNWLVKSGRWQAGDATIISNLPSTTPEISIETTWGQIKTLLAEQQYQAEKLINQLRQNVITAEEFFAKARVLYSTINGKIYKIREERIASLIQCFSTNQWQEFFAILQKIMPGANCKKIGKTEVATDISKINPQAQKRIDDLNFKITCLKAAGKTWQEIRRKLHLSRYPELFDKLKQAFDNV
jgi:hypothetical protein